MNATDLSTHALLDSQEKVVVQQATEFARDLVAKGAAERDACPVGNLDTETIKAGKSIGLLTMAVPREMGGLGLTNLAVSFVLEELAAADPGMALVFGATGLFQTPLLVCGDPDLQSEFLPPFLGDDLVLACNAVAEDKNGTDLVLPQHKPYAQNMTTAIPDGDHFSLSGTKKYITNAPFAKYATVMANLAGSPGSTGLTCFIVDLEQDGVRRGEIHDKVGYRTAPAGELVFDDVRIPKSQVINGVKGGWDLNEAIGNLTRVTCAAVSTGIARHALSRAMAWCAERQQSGHLLYQHQMSARKLADMATRVSASRALYSEAAILSDNVIPTPAYEPAAAKLFADRAAIENADSAMSLIGAQAFQRDDGMDRVLRDAYGPRIYEGTPEALALVITGDMFAGAVQP
ncbi:acyl-CoA/acyl-ACP dehydrogenase [Flexivirga sp. ID2601S]|uniref:Acyl-CoA/acyl-ACP dehydrogenase n=1 Tax=Flexivirga aerilata TaxID=1656889 RepID=A0A849ANK1_9MICO|nr:acyl-CoA dehydrogenase family protein [Flexivirga aerilata]NNG38382.1 acyl-CoA/acyl-ACP dehydrogenase [Flexivirga aerilata]